MGASYGTTKYCTDLVLPRAADWRLIDCVSSNVMQCKAFAPECTGEHSADRALATAHHPNQVHAGATETRRCTLSRRLHPCASACLDELGLRRKG